MRVFTFALLPISCCLFLAACASTGSGSGNSKTSLRSQSQGRSQARSAAQAQRPGIVDNGPSAGSDMIEKPGTEEGKRRLAGLTAGVKQKGAVDPKFGAPSKLVHDLNDVPAAVRDIEDFIDVKSALIADDILIEVSRNYQFDVSLTGKRVGRVIKGKQGTDRLAFGPATAFIRNLRIRGDKQIRLRIAQFGTKPFIRITARGHCSHIIAPSGSRPKIERADAILIRNDKIRYLRNQKLASATAKTKTP